jgi:hypothetical protein
MWIKKKTIFLLVKNKDLFEKFGIGLHLLNLMPFTTLVNEKTNSKRKNRHVSARQK